MSELVEEGVDQTIRILFQNKNLTGYQIAKNNEIAIIVKRDSTDFAHQMIHHERGTQIVCQLIDIALRPRILIKYLQDQKDDNILFKKQSVNTQPNQITTIIYNAVQILTNQYEDFVQYIFQQQKSDQNRSDSQQNPKELNNQSPVSKESNQNDINRTEKQSQQQQDWDDCVVMGNSQIELTKNQQDSMLKKINDLSKLNNSQFLRCSVLDRMFLLFDQPAPIQETPVSYFNKIILQFVYQRPEQIMRFFYCDQNIKGKKNSRCSKIGKMAQHLYNNSVVELIVHIMQLQNDGNFFVQQKIEILRTVVEQVFIFQQAVKEQNVNGQINTFQQSTIISQTMQQKVQNYVLVLKSLYDKLQDRYEQQKFIPIFKYHLNDQKLLQMVINYFFLHFNYFDMSGLLSLLSQTLKMDQSNFRLHRILTKNANPFINNNNFSFNSKNEESSIASYDLKLSKQILDQIQKVITKLSAKYQQWQGSTARMIEYYELIHSWLNVTFKDRQQYAGTALITSHFINQCLFKIQYHQNSTILHNSVKNILVDFLPKINESIKIVLSPQCQLIAFIENYLQSYEKRDKKKMRKCYENQLYHIGKAVVSVWEQQKMLNVIKKTEDDQQDESQRMPTQWPNSPTSDGQNIIRIQNLKRIIRKKQQFYEHLICGDPRKMGQYQQEESSEIIIASSFKNYFKPTLNINFDSQSNASVVKTPLINRYEEQDDNQTENIQQSKDQVEDLRREQNLDSNVKYRNLRLGEGHGNSIFQSAISPLNANRSHTFNFDFDVLPLDSDNSDQIQSSSQGDLPVKSEDGSGNMKQAQIKLLQDNMQTLQMVPANVLGVQSNFISSDNSNTNQGNLVTSDNDTREPEQHYKDIDVPNTFMKNIQRVDSYLSTESPQNPPEEDVFNLELNSKGPESKIIDQNTNSKLQCLPQSSIKQEPVKTFQVNDEESETVDNNLVTYYSSYLNYDIDQLCSEIEQI